MLAILLLSACGAPAAVRPTLDALASLGYACEEGRSGTDPSGLTEWWCSASSTEPERVVFIDGDDTGVAEVRLSMGWLPATPADPDAVRDEYRRLVAAVPPLDAAPVLLDALAGWTGEQQAMTIGGVRVMAQCRASWCDVIVQAAPNPNGPIRLP